MFCKKCGQEMLNSAKFCPKCGTPTPVMPHQETSFEQNPTTFNNIPGKTSSTLGTAIAIPRQFFSKKIIMVIISLIVVISLISSAISYSISNHPLSALAVGTQNLAVAVSKVKSGHISLTSDSDYGFNANINFETNIKKHKICAYGNISYDGGSEKQKIAVNVNNNDGAICYSNSNGTYSYSMPSSELKKIWTSIDAQDGRLSKKKLSKYIKENNLDDEFKHYIDLDEIDSASKKIIKQLGKRSTQKKIEEALEIEKKSNGLEKIYSMDLNGENMADAVLIVLKIVQDKGDDAIKGDWLDDLINDFDSDKQDYFDNLSYNDDINIDNMGKMSWYVKSSKLRKFTCNINSNEKIKISANFDYSFRRLDEAYGSVGISGDSVKFKINKINDVDDVIDSIPKKMLKKMNID
jgi:hypothetical protein